MGYFHIVAEGMPCRDGTWSTCPYSSCSHCSHSQKVFDCWVDFGCFRGYLASSLVASYPYMGLEEASNMEDMHSLQEEEGRS